MAATGQIMLSATPKVVQRYRMSVVVAPGSS
jgi:hypothetical protein